MRAGGGAPLPLRIAARLLPADAREEVLGDLLEKWAGEVSQRPWRSRVLWAWQQPWMALTARLRYGHRADARWARFTQVRPGFSLLDWKLGFRMLIKDPGLSLIGGLALACVIGFGAGLVHVAQQFWFPDLGLDDGDRIVSVDRLDAGTGDRSPTSVEEFVVWREKLSQVVELSAARIDVPPLVSTGGTDGVTAAASLRVAEVTAPTFPLTRVRPLRGRVISEADERPGAPDVIVVGYDAWQNLLGADPNVIGRELQLGQETVTVIGIMPEGFVFPGVEAWVPLRLSELSPDAFVRPLGRLAAEASLKSAQAELEIVGRQTAAERDVRIGAVGEASMGDSRRALSQVRVRRFEQEAVAGQNLLVAIFTSFIFILCMTAVCASVATLQFARTARRDAEIVVRNALGASRGRIAGQLFVEALVLSLVAAAVGIASAQWLIDYALSGPLWGAFQLPYWWRNTFEIGTILVAGGLAVPAAALVSVLPAIKATGKGVNDALKGWGTSLRVGGIWSVIIVSQVAITVLCMPWGVEFADDVWLDSQRRLSIPVERYLTFRLLRRGDSGASASFAELERRLTMEPGFEGITYGSARPGLPNSSGAIVEIESFGAGDSVPASRIGVLNPSVDVQYFETLGLPVVAGRGFNAGDVGAPNQPIVINESFARFLGDRALGRRLRYPPTDDRPEPGPWLEVVGVVRNVELTIPHLVGGSDTESRTIYFPVSAATVLPLGNNVWVAVKTSDPVAFASRLRVIVAEVSPESRLLNVLPLDVAFREEFAGEIFKDVAGGAGILLCILLCAASLSAIMAVAVATRNREVGIRLALGATRRQVLSALFGRAAKQLMLGIAIGSAPHLLLAWPDGQGSFVPVLIVVSVMLLVGLGACALPAQHALRIQPLDAIRE